MRQLKPKIGPIMISRGFFIQVLDKDELKKSHNCHIIHTDYTLFKHEDEIKQNALILQA
jgi:hypothetical protein